MIVRLTLALLLLATVAHAKDLTFADVRPIFTKYCTGCHNPVDNDGELSLETYGQLMSGGESGASIAPNKAAESLLVKTLTGKAKPFMPPKRKPKPSPAQIKLIEAWINQGAKGDSGKTLPTLTTPTIATKHRTPAAITTMAYAPDGETFAIGRFKTVELRNATNHDLEEEIIALPGKVNAIEFTADGKRLIIATGISGLYGRAIIWDLEEATIAHEFTGHHDTLYDATITPDGKLLATASYDQDINLWSIETGQLVRTISGHNGAVYDLDFNPDGTILASAGGDETVKIWDVATGQRLDTMNQPLDEQYVVKFSPNGNRVLAGGADNRIRVWHLKSRTEPQINPLAYARFAHEGPVVQLEFTPDGKGLISAAEDGTIKLWNTADYTQLKLYEKQPDVVTAVAVSPSRNQFHVGRMDGTIENYRFKLITPEITETPDTHVQASAIESTEPKQVAEIEPNDTLTNATPLPLPAVAKGIIDSEDRKQATDWDLFRFNAKQGEQWVFEIKAARDKSLLDSRIEILYADGKPVPRVLLQAVRDSYFTFRGHNSTTSDGFRLHNWEEMELEQFLYANGEVVKLWHYPRGPDSGFKLYPSRGDRFTYFETTAVSHPLQSPAYIVTAHAPGTTLIPNGLPQFTLHYANDDESQRRLGNDSYLTFTAPATGTYFVRVSDTRGFDGSKYQYQLIAKAPKPDFIVKLDGHTPTVNAGAGRTFRIKANRLDGFEGPLDISVKGLPPGFSMTDPLSIQAGQNYCEGSLYAEPDAPKPTKENASTSKLFATGTINGKKVTKEFGTFGELKLEPAPKATIAIAPIAGEKPRVGSSGYLEFTIAPGETIRALVRAERVDFKDRIEFGGEVLRNSAHGVYVDNIGLNGLMVLPGQTEREFFITASPIAKESSRLVYLNARGKLNVTSKPIWLHVQAKSQN